MHTYLADRMISFLKLLKVLRFFIFLNLISISLVFAQKQKSINSKINLNKEVSFQGQNVLGISSDSLQLINEMIEKSDLKAQDSLLFHWGEFFKKTGDYNLSAFYYYKGLSISNELNKPSEQAKYLNNLGIIFSRSKNFNKSRSFYQKALNVYSELGDSLRISYLYNNISMLYYRENNYDLALEYYEIATKIKTRLGISGLDLHPNNPGQFYHKLGRFEEAIYYHRLALQYLNELSKRDIYKEAISHQYIGDIFLDMEDLPNAIKSYETSLDLAKQIGAKKIIENVFGGLSNVYASLQDFKNAYYYNEQQKLYIDTLTKYSNQASVLKAQFDSEVQNKELELFKTNSQYEHNRKNFIILSISVTFIFSLGLIYIVFYNYKKNQESRVLINRNNDLLKEQQINQLLQEKELKSMKAFIDGQEKERLRIARDLHDGLGGTLAGLRLNFERSINSDLTNGLNELTEGLDQVYQEVRTVASNLAPPKFQSTYFTDILSSYISDVLKSNKIEVNSEFQPENELNILPEKIKVELYRILQEIITNILKHAAATSIEIQLLKHENFINLIVEDNGKGFNTNKKYKGMGVTNVSSRVALLNGKLDIDSKENRGTMFNIDIPIAGS